MQQKIMNQSWTNNWGKWCIIDDWRI